MLQEATPDDIQRRGLRLSPVAIRVAIGYGIAATLVAAFLSAAEMVTPSLPALLALTGWAAFSALLLHVILDRLSNRAALARFRNEHAALRESEACLDTVVGALPDGLVVAGPDGVIHSANPAAMRMFGGTPVGETVESMLAEPHASRLRAGLMAFAERGDETVLGVRGEAEGRRADGAKFPLELSVAAMESRGERHFVLVLHDITARAKVLARLDVADKVLDCTAEGVMVTDANSTIEWVNQGFSNISGYGRDEVVGRPASVLRSGLQGPEFYAEMWAAIRATGQWSGEIWNRRKDGEAYPEWLSIRAITDRSGKVVRFVGVFSDISKHKRAEETIRTLTYYDAVTRLPNRYLFNDRLGQALERSSRSARKAALVMIGLDRFKQINETLGHQTGDHLLREVADRLAGLLRGHDTVARLRGDTFCCLLTELGQDHEAHGVISRLLDCFGQSFQVGEHEVFLTASLGISVFPTDGNDPDELVVKAETAMNRSKERADHVCQYYTPEMHANSVVRLSLETSLRKALAREEFTLFYQPKIDTATGRLAGAEALLRWHHPEMGMIPPTEFIPIAEETGLIVPIGAWVLDHACARLRAWQDEGTPVVPIAVNLSAHQFHQPDLVDRVVQALETHDLDPALIELELTESAVMRNAETAISTLMDLHSQGIRLSVDDFGTGYSSLSYLKKFPLDKLKIDRSFVLDIDTNPSSVEIVGAIIAMAHSLNLAVVAEGVEREEQLNILRSLRCDEIQGFYYSRPVPEDVFTGLLHLGRLAGKAA